MNTYTKIVAAAICALMLASCGSADTQNTEDDKVAVAGDNTSSNTTAEAKPESIEAEPTPTGTTASSGSFATMELEEKEFDFGKIKEGEKVNHVFKFKNTGEVPLTITNTHTTCGCTVPSYSKEPVQPGAEGEVNVVFDSKGKVGTQRKTVTVIANVEGGSQTFTLKGEVVREELTQGPYRQ